MPMPACGGGLSAPKRLDDYLETIDAHAARTGRCVELMRSICFEVLTEAMQSAFSIGTPSWEEIGELQAYIRAHGVEIKPVPFSTKA